MAKTEKFQIIDLVRSFAIVSVMIIHLRRGLYPPKEEWARFILDHFSKNGAYGVSLFFVVSGFLISGVIDSGANGLFHPDFKKFYVQRAGRILPLLVLTVLFGSIVVQFIDDPSAKFQYCFITSTGRMTAGYWFSLLTFTYNWFLLFNKYGLGIHFMVLWSLSVEEQFYLLYPYMLKKLQNQKNIFILLVSVVFLSFFWRLGLFFFNVSDTDWAIRSSFGAFDQIAFGVLLYLAHKNFSDFLSRNPGICSGICASGFLLGALIYFGTSYKNSLDIVFSPTLLSLGTSAFLLGGIHLPFFGSKILNIFSLPGKYCYGSYLLHTSIIYFFHTFLAKFHALVACVIFIVLTTVVAAISYHFFEMPMNHLVRKTLGAEPKNG